MLINEPSQSAVHWKSSSSIRFNKVIKGKHPCPSCKCPNSILKPDIQQEFHKSCTLYAIDRFGQTTKQFLKIFKVKGENVDKDKVILSRSMSPYSKRITITYQSPKNRNCTSTQKISVKNILTKPTQQPETAEVVRPKILDKKKIKEKQKPRFISFKSVKSASTDLFLNTPTKQNADLERQYKQGNTDETRSIKSLSRVSIDEKFFQL